MTKEGVAQVRSQLGTAPLFDAVLKTTQEEVDEELEQSIEVPVPKDMAGGYTHERHKKNWFILQKAGALFQITGDEKYAIYIRDMLRAYAELYPTLPLHPTNRSYATGKIFWQCLNDANWLVYVSQAYDCIYDWLSEEETRYFNEQLFRPYADFISIQNPQFFNRIHNHSTWANAAVGMIGLVMDDEELIQRSLYGLAQDELPEGIRDDDSGLIKTAGQTKAGFLAQLDYSFSPDGYFTEGPYYLRYALSPFLLFGKSLANNRPDLGILSYRDGILKKAVYSLLYQANYQGEFFPINDAQKGMSWKAREVIAAIDYGYYHFGKDPMLLSIAEEQGVVVLDEAGFAVAQAIAEGKSQPFLAKSIAFRDGPDGDEGGVGILRATSAEGRNTCLVMKYSAQGMGHGHFDKLSYSLYDDTGEVVQDYGAARWVNIDQKGGGRYLKENRTWAKQSIAHNTLVVNENSHYEGDIRIGELHHPDLYSFSVENETIQMVSAEAKNAYPGRVMHRSLLLLKDEAFQQPVLIDLFRVEGGEPAQYDLPTWFQGHVLSANFPYESDLETRKTLGDGAGYQHIWHEATGQDSTGNAQVCWFSNGRFYTQTNWVAPEDDLLFVRLGANDPSFNLRPDPAFIVRKKDQASATFISVLEAHGEYNPVGEIPLRPFGSITHLGLLHQDEYYTAISLQNTAGKHWTILLANQDADKNSQHNLQLGERTHEWRGPLALIIQNEKN